MPNPLISQGTLNRLRGSVVWASFDSLNITAPYLGKGGISLGFGGDSTVFIDTMTGAVTSPEPYIRAQLRIELLKTQSLADAFKTQMETNSILGDCTVRPDSAALSPYQLTNCAIEGVADLQFNGEVAGYAIRISGYYNINSALFDI